MKNRNNLNPQNTDESPSNIQDFPSQIEMPTGGETSSEDELFRSFGFERWMKVLEGQGVEFDRSVLRRVTANTLGRFFKALGGWDQRLTIFDELLAQKSRRSLTFRQAVTWNLWVVSLSGKGK